MKRFPVFFGGGGSLEINRTRQVDVVSLIDLAWCYPERGEPSNRRLAQLFRDMVQWRHVPESPDHCRNQRNVGC